MKGFWADQIASQAIGDQVVNDAKTPSGRVHVGALRGVLIHDIIYKALVDEGKKAQYIYGSDDYDPMDSLPNYLSKEKYDAYMGMPLSEIPSPDGSNSSYADYYFEEFREVFESLGAKPSVYRTSELYKKGKFNDAIRLTLENSQKIREVYKKVSGSEKGAQWLPLNVVCEQCHKLGCTRVTAFDGKLVEYSCLPDYVKWAKGCGYSGKKSPFDGGGKLPYKVEWPAKWMIFNVTIEGAGKDHSTKGGTRDVSTLIYEEVYKRKAPFNLPYEFFLFGGKKMSSSKGVGVTAKEISSSLPSDLLRFLVSRFKPQTAIDFNPEGDKIPRLYDDWDKFARVYFKKEESRDPDVPRIFELSQTSGKKPKDFFRPPFSFVAFIAQVPSVNLQQAIEKYKGSKLTEEEKIELETRATYAKIWLEKFASEDDKISLAENPDWTTISPEAKKSLQEFSKSLGLTQEEQGDKIRQLCAENNVSITDFYQAAYQVLINKKKGPKLIPFINALDREMVVKRLSGQA